MATLVATGRLGRPAECRTTPKGTKVLEFSIAVDHGWGDTKTTMWIKCAMFGDRAEKLVSMMDKGTLVEIAGTPQIETWVSKSDGKPAAGLKVTVSDLKFHGGGKKDDAPVADRGRATSQGFDEDSIPF